MCSITATSLSVNFVIYGIVNHFETVVLLSFLMQFSYVQLIYFSPRVFKVFIFKFIKSKVSHNSHMFESDFIHQYIRTICYSFLAWRNCSETCSDIEENPGPKPSSNQSFSVCHWNLNSISAHTYIKVSLLRAYISTHKLDVICISETYLDSDTSDDDDNLKIADSSRHVAHLADISLT